MPRAARAVRFRCHPCRCSDSEAGLGDLTKALMGVRAPLAWGRKALKTLKMLKTVKTLKTLLLALHTRMLVTLMLREARRAAASQPSPARLPMPWTRTLMTTSSVPSV